MDAEILRQAERAARDEFSVSFRQPKDWLRLAARLEEIVNQGGDKHLLDDVKECRRIADAVMNLKQME